MSLELCKVSNCHPIFSEEERILRRKKTKNALKNIRTWNTVFFMLFININDIIILKGSDVNKI